MKRPPHPATDLHLSNPGFQLIEVAPPGFVQTLKKDYQKSREKPSLLKKIYHYLRYKRGLFNACRMPDFADFWIRPAFKSIEKSGSWDLVISTAGPYAVHIIGEKMKKRGLARRWIADYRDNWSDNHIYPGLFPFTVIESLLEKKLMRSADAIVATSGAFASKMKSRYPHDKVHVIENGFDPDDFAALPKPSIFPQDGKFRIVYTGTIYPGKQDPSPFFQALAELRSDKLEVLFVGHQHDHLEKLIERYGVASCIRLLGFVSREEALRMQRDANLLLFIVWKNLAERGVYSGKIYEYLFSGTPILAIGAQDMEESQALILESRAGVALHDPQSIKHYLEEQLQKEKSRTSPDSSVIARFNRHSLADKMLQL